MTCVEKKTFSNQMSIFWWLFAGWSVWSKQERVEFCCGYVCTWRRCRRWSDPNFIIKNIQQHWHRQKRISKANIVVIIFFLVFFLISQNLILFVMRSIVCTETTYLDTTNIYMYTWIVWNTLQCELNRTFLAPQSIGTAFWYLREPSQAGN